MTRNESFKRRVRERMAKTGEKRGAARHVLIEEAANRSSRTWVSEPDQSEAAVRRATGRGWSERYEIVAVSPDRPGGRTALTAWLQEDHDVGFWSRLDEAHP